MGSSSPCSEHPWYDVAVYVALPMLLGLIVIAMLVVGEELPEGRHFLGVHSEEDGIALSAGVKIPSTNHQTTMVHHGEEAGEVRRLISQKERPCPAYDKENEQIISIPPRCTLLLSYPPVDQ